eukprot:g900.t1
MSMHLRDTIKPKSCQLASSSEKAIDQCTITYPADLMNNTKLENEKQYHKRLRDISTKLVVIHNGHCPATNVPAEIDGYSPFFTKLPLLRLEYNTKRSKFAKVNFTIMEGVDDIKGTLSDYLSMVSQKSYIDRCGDGENRPTDPHARCGKTHFALEFELGAEFGGKDISAIDGTKHGGDTVLSTFCDPNSTDDGKASLSLVSYSTVTFVGHIDIRVIGESGGSIFGHGHVGSTIDYLYGGSSDKGIIVDSVTMETRQTEEDKKKIAKELHHNAEGEEKWIIVYIPNGCYDTEESRKANDKKWMDQLECETSKRAYQLEKPRGTFTNNFASTGDVYRIVDYKWDTDSYLDIDENPMYERKPDKMWLETQAHYWLPVIHPTNGKILAKKLNEGDSESIRPPLPPDTVDLILGGPLHEMRHVGSVRAIVSTPTNLRPTIGETSFINLQTKKFEEKTSGRNLYNCKDFLTEKAKEATISVDTYFNEGVEAHFGPMSRWPVLKLLNKNRDGDEITRHLISDAGSGSRMWQYCVLQKDRKTVLLEEEQENNPVYGKKLQRWKLTFPSSSNESPIIFQVRGQNKFMDLIRDFCENPKGSFHDREQTANVEVVKKPTGLFSIFKSEEIVQYRAQLIIPEPASQFATLQLRYADESYTNSKQNVISSLPLKTPGMPCQVLVGEAYDPAIETCEEKCLVSDTALFAKTKEYEEKSKCLKNKCAPSKEETFRCINPFGGLISPQKSKKSQWGEKECLSHNPRNRWVKRPTSLQHRKVYLLYDTKLRSNHHCCNVGKDKLSKAVKKGTTTNYSGPNGFMNEDAEMGPTQGNWNYCRGIGSDKSLCNSSPGCGWFNSVPRVPKKFVRQISFREGNDSRDFKVGDSVEAKFFCTGCGESFNNNCPSYCANNEMNSNKEIASRLYNHLTKLSAVVKVEHLKNWFQKICSEKAKAEKVSIQTFREKMSSVIKDADRNRDEIIGQ